MKRIQSLLFLLFFVSCNTNQSGRNSNSDNLGMDTAADTYTVTQEDIAMNLAIDKAKKTIDVFDKVFVSKNSSCTDFAIKKKYLTPDGGGEHMWIAAITLFNGGYKGIINNDAEATTEVKYGDTVIVRKEEITDWMYLDNNVLKGGYTIRALRDRMNKEEKIKMDKEMGFRIED